MGRSCRSVAENVVIRPAGKVEPSACRQEIETGPGEFGSFLALQPNNQHFAQGMQIAHIGCRIFALGLVELVGER